MEHLFCHTVAIYLLNTIIRNVLKHKTNVVLFCKYLNINLVLTPFFQNAHKWALLRIIRILEISN